MTFVDFVRKLEGKPKREVKPKFPVHPLPTIWNREYFEYVIEETSLTSPGEEVEDPEAFGLQLEDAFNWLSTAVSDSIWEDLRRTGYMHPECYELLNSWRQQVDNGTGIPDEEEEFAW